MRLLSKSVFSLRLAASGSPVRLVPFLCPERFSAPCLASRVGRRWATSAGVGVTQRAGHVGARWRAGPTSGWWA